MRQKTERGEGIALSDNIFLPVGELPAGKAYINEKFGIPFSDDSAQDFNITFSARNGMWTELLRLRKIKDHWSYAIRVIRRITVDGSQIPETPIYEEVDKDYPRNDSPVA
jgi:hypothetical protein